MIKVEIDTAAFRREASGLARQLPYATALALNDTARDVVEGLQEEERKVFDRPTPYTLNAFRVQRATKAVPVATVLLKDRQAGKHFLRVEAAGGVRPQTALEKLLALHVPYSGDLRSVIPADGAKLDRYGNWSGGQRSRVLSQLKAQRDSRMNETARSKRRSTRRGTSRYFVPRQGLTPGVYRRVNKRNVEPVLYFSGAAARYRRRLDPQRVALRVVRERLSRHVAVRLSVALAGRRR